MKKLIYISLILFILTACEKEREVVIVKYEVSNAYTSTQITYKNSDGQIVAETVDFESVEDVWNYNFQDKRGEIVYLGASYNDSTSSVNIQIIVDGKVYKQGSSNNEPYKYLIVSGTIPY